MMNRFFRCIDQFTSLTYILGAHWFGIRVPDIVACTIGETRNGKTTLSKLLREFGDHGEVCDINQHDITGSKMDPRILSMLQRCRTLNFDEFQFTRPSHDTGLSVPTDYDCTMFRELSGKAVISHDMKWGDYGEYTSDGQLFMFSNEGVLLASDPRFKARLGVYLSQRARKADEPSMVADFAKWFAETRPTQCVLAMVSFATLFSKNPWRSARPLSSLMSYGKDLAEIEQFLSNFHSRIHYSGKWSDARTLDDLWQAVHSVPAPDYAKTIANGSSREHDHCR